MLFKNRQQITTHRYTTENHAVPLLAREFIINYLRFRRTKKTSGAVRASLGFVSWKVDKSQYPRTNIAHRASCFITGRARGTSQRHSIARTKIKEVMSTARLLGVSKSSW